MATATRAMVQASRSFDRQARDAGDEFRDRRLSLGLSQDHVAAASRMSRNRYGLIENGRCPTTRLVELNRIAAVLGLAASFRIFPAGPAVRDAGHARRLADFLALVQRPLTFRVEVPLPRTEDRPEQRAWDAMLFGHRSRTAIELEMRLREVQAVRRRIDMKRRDDPTEGFMLLIADTRHTARSFASLRAVRGSPAPAPKHRPCRARGRAASTDWVVAGLAERNSEC